ncbi:porin [Neptunomonas sp.]|uniref:porin n=1 Tax=Neptunomonas sp. TaxID=1971898 RepID=UPI0035645FCA
MDDFDLKNKKVRNNMTKLSHKLLLATALLSSSAMAVDVAGTDVEFYGSLRIMLEQAEYNDDTQFKDASSRIGIKANRDLGEGLSAFAKYEVSVNLEDEEDTLGDMRLGHLGLASETYGSISLGKVDSSFYTAVASAADYPWWNSAPVFYTLDGNQHVSESFLYESAEMSGLSVSALIQIDGDTASEEESQLSATYSAGPVGFGATYVEAADGDDIYGVSVTYEADSFFVNGAYMDKKNVGSGVDAILGVPSGDNLYMVGLSDYSDEADEDFTALILAYERSLHESVVVWAEFMTWDGNLYGDVDSNQLNIGMNFNF